MNVLKNCPNCGGTLQDDGRCRFCGSKVYDFVNINFDNPAPTYIRFQQGNQIITCPVIIHTVDITIEPSPYLDVAVLGVPERLCTTHTSGTIDFDVIGDTITEVSADE